MSALARPREWLEGKVQPRHRDRLAAVYVRQSTAQQVHDHQESTRLQYGLADRAAALGWGRRRGVRAGCYEPADHSDRLVLGLEGRISEAGLHLIKQRMWTGRLAKAGRGQLGGPLPAGYVRRSSGEVALDPDEQARAV